MATTAPGSIALLLLLAATAGAEPPPAGVWNTGTVPPPSPPAGTAAPAALPLRVYEGLGAVGPLYAPADDAAFAVDVVAEFAACADGSRIITALRIAGQRYPLASRCATRGTPAGTGDSGDSGQLRCDARRWTCRSGDHR